MVYLIETKNTRLFVTITLSIALLFSFDIQALSLDEAINRQLDASDFGIPCSGGVLDYGLPDLQEGLAVICNRPILLSRSLYVGGGATNPTLALKANSLDIFSQEVLNESIYSSIGIGSVTSTAIPNLDAGYYDESQKSDNKLENKHFDYQSWSFFFTAENEALERKTSISENGFDSSLARLLAGVAYISSASTAYGIALDKSEQKGDFEGAGNRESAGAFRFDSTGLRLFGSFSPTTKMSLRVAIAYDHVTAERRRFASFYEVDEGGWDIISVEGNPSANYKYNQYGFSFQGAYEFSLGRLMLSPQVGVDWLSTDYGTYSEQGDSGLELTFHNDKRKSLQFVMGIQSAYVIGTKYGVFIPQFNLLWRHEFNSDERDVSVSFVHDPSSMTFSYQTDILDERFAELSFGSVFVFKHGTQVFMNLKTLKSHKYFNSVSVSTGLRIEL